MTFKRGDLIKFSDDKHSWWYCDTHPPSGDGAELQNSEVPFLELIEYEKDSDFIVAYVPTHNLYLVGVGEWHFTHLAEPTPDEQT